MAHPIEVGVYIPPVAMGFADLVARAQLCESLGLTSFWLYDHLYAPGLPGQPALEAWTLATALLARTTRLRVGHLVLDNNLRHPALLAKMASTLDVISAGRLDLGLGSGSWAPEHVEGGFPWGTAAERAERLGEALEIITRMFTGEPVSFAGRHYRVEGLRGVPRPAQRPGPPIHVGGVGERLTLPLVARYADVWNVPTYGLAHWERRVGVLEAACERVGRDPASIRRSQQAVLVLAPDDAALADAQSRAERRYAGPRWGVEAGGFVGTPPAIVERIVAQVERGITLFIFLPWDRGGERTLRLLAEEVMPHVT